MTNLDFPTAWAIQADLNQSDHDPRCSSVPGQHSMGTTWIPATLTQRLSAALTRRRAPSDQADVILGRRP